MAAKTNTINEKLPEEDNQLPVDAMPENELVRQAVVEDPVVRFLYKHRDAIFYTLVAIVAGILGYRWYLQEHARSQTSAAAVYASLQDNYRQILETSADGKVAEPALLLKFESDVKTLAPAGEPYASLSAAYGEKILIVQKKYKEAAAALEKTDWQKISTAAPQGFVAELRVLFLAKSLLTEKDYQKQAKAALKSLAEQGTYAAWPAFSALYASSDDTEKKGLEAQKQTLKSRFPELSDLVDKTN